MSLFETFDKWHITKYTDTLSISFISFTTTRRIIPIECHWECLEASQITCVLIIVHYTLIYGLLWLIFIPDKSGENVNLKATNM